MSESRGVQCHDGTLIKWKGTWLVQRLKGKEPLSQSRALVAGAKPLAHRDRPDMGEMDFGQRRLALAW